LRRKEMYIAEAWDARFIGMNANLASAILATRDCN